MPSLSAPTTGPEQILHSLLQQEDETPRVTAAYIKQAVDNARHILWYQTPHKNRDNEIWDRMDVFRESYYKVKGVPKIYYIDLVCSKHKKGALMRCGGASKWGCKINFRAADKHLMPYYTKCGYHRSFNRC